VPTFSPEAERSTAPSSARANQKSISTAPLRVALLTGGRDKPYALGLGPALADHGLALDFIGSDHVDGPEVRQHGRIRFLNFRNQALHAPLWTKMTRVLVYYLRLIAYAAQSKASVFHILWNNKFEHFDRTLLILYYRLLGKRVVFTAHNVNVGKRDGNDSRFNRLTLRIQYRLCHHVFVHTHRMKQELLTEFGVPEAQATVIPFGINNTLPNSALTRDQARRELKLDSTDEVLLFFGNIAPYKGVSVLIEALGKIAPTSPNLRLIIAGRTKGAEDYWKSVRQSIDAAGLSKIVHEHIEYIPDEKVEVFFKASDVLVLPYTHVFQSGVLFLGYSFGLPVIATDVGSLREEIIENRTGFVCASENSADLARAIIQWMTSDLRREREACHADILEYANNRYAWNSVGAITAKVYERLATDQTKQSMEFTAIP